MNQPIVKYGSDVEKIDANSAVNKYNPKVVIGSWVTGQYDIKGLPLNQHGPLEKDIIDNCGLYVMIGNHSSHHTKDIMTIPHRRYSAPWLVSRSRLPQQNSIYIWSKKGYPFNINASRHKVKMKIEVIKENNKKHQVASSYLDPGYLGFL